MSRYDASGPNRILLEESIRIFLTEMVPYVIESLETSEGQPLGDPAMEQYDRAVGSNTIQDPQGDDRGFVDFHRALDRISLTVDCCWPVFKKRLRNRRAMRSALTQVSYANVFTAQEAHEESDLEPLYVEQRLDDMTNVLGRIGAQESKGRIDEMKKAITAA